MTLIFNQKTETLKRKFLRRTRPLAEKILWPKLKSRRFYGYKFRRQYSIYSFVVDFYCPKFKFAIEIDGDSHFNKKTQEYDQMRQRLIEDIGIRFLRFTNTDIYENLEEVLEKIKENLK